jgi:predicted O-methyltransferase YrrM
LPRVTDVSAVVGDLPYMSRDRADLMASLIAEHDVHDVLELGFLNGVSTCYLAAALAEQGDGHVVTIDRAVRTLNDPRIETLLDELALRDRVTVFYEFDSYNWRLHHFLAQSPRPQFDLIYLDGAHTWNVDGFAFLLAEQFLSPGGLFVFDALHWSFAQSRSTRSKTAMLPPDEREFEQVKLVFDLLVKPHPNMEECWEDGVWGFARKRATAARDLTSRGPALALIKEQAADALERAESAVSSGKWEYAPWPRGMLPLAEPPRQRQVDRELILKLKQNRAWLEYKLGIQPAPPAADDASDAG